MAKAKYYFLCEFFKGKSLIYAIKSSVTKWHYFEEEDSMISVHLSLPADLRSQFLTLEKLQEVPVDLDWDQVANYVADGKFVFNGKELNTYIQLIQSDQSMSRRKKVSKSSDDLVFAVGKSNPAVFLKDFEECDDIKTNNDKVYKIRNFVNLEDKGVFSELFFKSYWSTARSTFLRKYSLAFTQNKKRELDFTFNEETSVRSFVSRKMTALSTYTRLSVQNQLEIILSELPVEVSNLFILHDKMNCKKTDILEFCDAIQEMMEPDDESDKNATLKANAIDQSQVIQDLELFNYDPKIVSEVYSSEVETSKVETSDLEVAAGGRKKLVNKSTKRSRTERLSGRPSKIKRIVCTNDHDDDEDYYDDDQSATSSCSNF